MRWHSDITLQQRLLLCDAQTSGGLLISVPEARTDALLRELEANGVEGSVVIGGVGQAGKEPIVAIP